MIKTNAAAEFVQLIRDVAGSTAAAGLVVGEVKSGGSILIGDTIIDSDDYSIISQTFTFDGNKIVLPAFEEQKIEWTNAIGIMAPAEETHTIIFQPIKSGDNVLLWQNSDGDYILIGKIG